MRSLKQHLLRFWNDESGQGATEYILLLVIVVAVALLFKGKIMAVIGERLDYLQQQVTNVTAQ